MAATEDTLNLFSTRVRQMILQYKELKKENAELYSMVDEKDKQVENLKAQITQAQNDYNCPNNGCKERSDVDRYSFERIVGLSGFCNQ